MGVLIVLGTALVIGVVIKRIYAKPAAPSMSAMAPGVLPGAVAASAVLPAEAHIAGIAGAGGAIAVWVSGPGGDEVLLIDPASGAVRRALSTQK
jgi:hypothetical protein